MSPMEPNLLSIFTSGICVPIKDDSAPGAATAGFARAASVGLGAAAASAGLGAAAATVGVGAAAASVGLAVIKRIQMMKNYPHLIECYEFFLRGQVQASER